MIGKKLREYRTQNRYSTTLLAQLSGVNRGTISKIEHGHISPTVDTLEKLAKAMETTVAVFFEQKVEYKQPKEAS